MGDSGPARGSRRSPRLLPQQTLLCWAPLLPRPSHQPPDPTHRYSYRTGPLGPALCGQPSSRSCSSNSDGCNNRTNSSSSSKTISQSCPSPNTAHAPLYRSRTPLYRLLSQPRRPPLPSLPIRVMISSCCEFRSRLPRLPMMEGSTSSGKRRLAAFCHSSSCRGSRQTPSRHSGRLRSRPQHPFCHNSSRSPTSIVVPSRHIRSLGSRAPQGRPRSLRHSRIPHLLCIPMHCKGRFCSKGDMDSIPYRSGPEAGSCRSEGGLGALLASISYRLGPEAGPNGCPSRTMANRSGT